MRIKLDLDRIERTIQEQATTVFYKHPVKQLALIYSKLSFQWTKEYYPSLGAVSRLGPSDKLWVHFERTQELIEVLMADTELWMLAQFRMCRQYARPHPWFLYSEFAEGKYRSFIQQYGGTVKSVIEAAATIEDDPVVGRLDHGLYMYRLICKAHKPDKGWESRAAMVGLVDPMFLITVPVVYKAVKDGRCHEPELSRAFAVMQGDTPTGVTMRRWAQKVWSRR